MGIINPSAGGFPFTALMVGMSADAGPFDFTIPAPIVWDETAYNFLMPEYANDGNIVIPAGVEIAQFGCAVRMTDGVNDTAVTIQLQKNGTVDYPGSVVSITNDLSTSGTFSGSIWSAPIEVAEGDIIRVLFAAQGEGNTILRAGSWFLVRALA